MPQNTELAAKQWERYTYCRDNGHMAYVEKSRKCEEFFAGMQWDPGVLQELRDGRRPGLTINKILGTISSILGEQIDTRSETAFKGRFGAPSGNADIWTKLYRYISDRNQLDWRRSELFADGCITSRGYLDVRMNFDRSITGDVEITNLNPRCVIPDPDASEYDPDEWKDVFVTRWLTIGDIATLYDEGDADKLRGRGASQWAYGFDSVDKVRDRFGGPTPSMGVLTEEDEKVSRSVRVLDRQYRMLTKVKYFVNMDTGDRKMIPNTWERNKIVALVEQQGGKLIVDETNGFKIRWTVTADDFVLHDDWSPYRHFTPVPYFPYFRYGRTIGLVENLIDPQELLNKTTSQELHVVNTTANSGWKVRTGSLKNMTMDELETMGAKTGLVMELDDVKDAEKIQPNQIPQGLSQLSSKGENYIKSVSMRGDAQMGMTRADVSADQIEANNAYGDVGLRKPQDNLKRTDYILARNVMDMAQEYYTDPRIMSITHNELTGEVRDIQINWPDPISGEIQNDISMGEYDITIISQPAKESLEDSQFEQGAYLKEKLGVQIPDEFLIENSRLINKTALVATIKEAKQSPEAQLQQQMQVMSGQLEIANLKAEASKLEATALEKRAGAGEKLAKTQELMNGKQGEAEKAQMEMALDKQKHDQEMAQAREKHAMEMQIEREKAQAKLEEQKMLAQEKRALMQAQTIAAARAKPAAGGGEQRMAA
jgi:hypothetical protein